eukprot:1161914-Pelagomonas_calceolata.AAC.4
MQSCKFEDEVPEECSLIATILGEMQSGRRALLSATTHPYACVHLSTFKYLLSHVCTWMQAEVAHRRKALLNYMLFLRMTPLLPNVFINVASPIVGVPLHTFAIGKVANCAKDVSCAYKVVINVASTIVKVPLHMFAIGKVANCAKDVSCAYNVFINVASPIVGVPLHTLQVVPRMSVVPIMCSPMLRHQSWGCRCTRLLLVRLQIVPRGSKLPHVFMQCCITNIGGAAAHVCNRSGCKLHKRVSLLPAAVINLVSLSAA